MIKQRGHWSSIRVCYRVTEVRVTEKVYMLKRTIVMEESSRLLAGKTKEEKKEKSKQKSVIKKPETPKPKKPKQSKKGRCCHCKSETAIGVFSFVALLWGVAPLILAGYSRLFWHIIPVTVASVTMIVFVMFATVGVLCKSPLLFIASIFAAGANIVLYIAVVIIISSPVHDFFGHRDSGERQVVEYVLVGLFAASIIPTIVILVYLCKIRQKLEEKHKPSAVKIESAEVPEKTEPTQKSWQTPSITLPVPGLPVKFETNLQLAL